MIKINLREDTTTDPTTDASESETKDMKQPLQTTLLVFVISLILTAFSVNAETPQTTASQVQYNYYYHLNDLHEQKYHRFLPNPVPEELYYHTRITAISNVDETPEKETVVLMVVGTKPHADFGNWHQAFLLITSTKAGKLESKAFFKLFDVGTHLLDVPAAKAIELHNLTFGLRQPLDVSFKLADLTGDGILDVWLESVYGVALVSFENGEFQEVLTNNTVTRKKLAEDPDIEYYLYNVPSDPQGERYHRFSPILAPEVRYYNTRKTAIANVDDTPEKETIVLMTADTGSEGPRGEWTRAFLLIAENEADMLKKKDLFKLFDVWPYDFDVMAKTVELQSAPFVFREAIRIDPWQFGIAFSLVDLTGDGILDVWVESAYGVVVISFQNGEFVEVCSAYTSSRRKSSIEYIDIDKDSIYEIKIPDRISIDGPRAAYLPWMSFYEWDGTTYVLNNKRFYAENDEFLTRLLEQYIFWQPFSRFSRNEEIYHFYIGLIYSYRDNAPMARELLQRVVAHGKKQDYIQAAEELLKNLPHN